jgi:hypothetical protein
MYHASVAQQWAENKSKLKELRSAPLADARRGTDVMIFKIFSAKNSAKKLPFLTQNKDKLCIILIITLIFDKTTSFSAENCQK